MSDTTTTDTAIPGPQDAADATDTTSGTDTPDAATDAQPTNEAKKYRLRLRETEAALTAANERIAAMQRADAERIASSHLAEPGDLWSLGGSELADVLDDDGNISADAVTSLAEGIVKSRPGLRKQSKAVDPSQGRSAEVQADVSWSGLFKR